MNSKGLTLIEVICSFSVLMVASLLIVPLLTDIRSDQKALSEKRNAVSTLQNKLHEYTDSPIAARIENNIDGIKFTFEVQQDYIEGCASWEDRNNKTERLCLYAPP
ncbi:type II secretion system protein [Halobacillus andaensis]|uniref:type II secretion system protein n=1 Tax=Halobacillus andaensis TaxID=1176239 RepID=UPI003D71DE1A